jgi:DNA repair exonuclease SbcCD ATPase subunit
MKITKVTIVGMHKITSVTYDINDLNYLFGKNGAGKSTVMQAIQLALLGYIPGTDKNKTAIFKHSNGNVMSVYIQFDNGNSILRTYENKGKEIKANVQYVPESLDMSTILAELELPVFNFNEFASMTANKLKDWFISILPDCKVDIDLAYELRKAYPAISAVDPDLVDYTVNIIDGFDGSQIEQIRKFNDLCKANTSQYKVQSTRLTDTMQSLVFYEEFSNLTLEEVAADINMYDVKLQNVRNKISTYLKNSEMLSTLDSICKATGAETDEDFGRLMDTYSEKNKDISVHIAQTEAEISHINTKLNGIKADMSSQEKLLKGRGVCPYTNTICDSIKTMMSDVQSKYDTNRIDEAKYKSLLIECQSQLNAYMQDQKQIQSKLNTLQSQWTTFVSISKTVDKSLADVDMSTLEDEEFECKQKLEELRDTEAKVKANIEYNNLKAKVATDSLKAEQLLDVYKAWDKLSSVNGLQSKIMEAPFDQFSDYITKYLTQFFGEDNISASFYVGEKSNSFSFGIIRDTKYIEFDLLSSGEKCLYTLSMLMAIVENSKSELKLIMVDDLLDHLDDNRINDCFATLYNCKDMQTIIAGVKPCNHEAAGEFVIHI